MNLNLKYNNYISWMKIKVIYIVYLIQFWNKKT